MDRKPTSPAPTNKPSMLGSFFDGAKSGIFNSAMMMGIFGALSHGAVFIAENVFLSHAISGMALGLPGALISIVASTLFTGALGAKKAYDSTHSANAATVRSPSQGHSKTRSQEIELSESPSHTRSDWAERTGRSGGSRVAELLKKGTQEERNHAASLLETREQEANTSASRF